LVLTTPCVLADRSDEATKAEKLFALTVKPFLARKCFACHGGDAGEIQGELDLTSRDGMLRGGESSAEVLVPGHGAKSLLYVATTWTDVAYQMPPKENDRLTDDQTWAIRDWIDAGAPWPSQEKIAAILQAHANQTARGVLVRTSGGLTEDWSNRRYQPEDLWAYQPVRSPPIPRGFDTNAPHANPIDAFINRKLVQLGLDPAPRADRRDLIRRATYDLVGLPPTLADVEQFVRDPAPTPEAFAKLVDRLLDSPHYGEQWGRHWLDVVRYADTAGFANDFERPNAWRYRDYVIRSFNQDKPFDQFIMEQVAGDEIDPDTPEMLIAAGFLRMGPWEHTGMSVGKITRQQFLDEVTDTVGQVFLSHPLRCARCHDHKFDPIPTRDYYSVQAVFATTQFAGRDAPFLAEENTNEFEQEKRYLEQRVQRYEAILKKIRAKEEKAARTWYAERGLEYAPRWQLLKKNVSEDRIAPRHCGLSVADLGMDRIARKNLTRHKWELDRFRPIAFSVYSGTTRPFRPVTSRLRLASEPTSGGTLEQTAILAGGDPFSPTEKVQPGALSAISEFSDDGQGSGSDSIPESISGRRLAFARWIADPKNPLTARSIVNRIWQYHFGQGIAGNANNFGATGKKPTHPELLDWLAATFVAEGWSIKRLHRLIMNSDAYCRSSRHPGMADVIEKDPEGTSYAYFQPRRLAAEELRDSMLAVSGELNPEMGGIPIRPDMNIEAALQPRQIMGTYAPAYQPSPRPEQRNRRAIYAMRIRGLRDPLLEVFNQPSPDKSCEIRDSSTITPQVFALLNSQNSRERSLAMAVRLVKESGTPEETIHRAFALAYGRRPADDELQDCLEHWRAMTIRHAKIDLEPREYPVEVVRQAVEELSGETFSFVEKLEVYEDYVPDLAADDLNAETRGLAEVCLVLFNSNEFIYVP
jgi:mono/diheme cytochrome c family protein